MQERVRERQRKQKEKEVERMIEKRSNIETVRYTEKSVGGIVLTPFGVLCSIVVEPERNLHIAHIVQLERFSHLFGLLDSIRMHSVIAFYMHYTFQYSPNFWPLFNSRPNLSVSLIPFFVLFHSLVKSACVSLFLIFPWLHLHLFALFGRSLGKWLTASQPIISPFVQSRLMQKKLHRLTRIIHTRMVRLFVWFWFTVASLLTPSFPMSGFDVLFVFSVSPSHFSEKSTNDFIRLYSVAYTVHLQHKPMVQSVLSCPSLCLCFRFLHSLLTCFPLDDHFLWMRH